MKMAEVPMNIVTVPQGWYLACAISADLNFSVGLPKLFNDIYRLEYRIDNAKIGDVIIIDNSISLVVKESTFDKADISDLCCVLQSLRSKCEEIGITRLAIPKLCCGNNGLEWKDVKTVIRSIFKGSNVFIMVCV